MYSGIGKLVYEGDIKYDSNFGILSVSPKLSGILDWAEILLGGSLITDLPDPYYQSPLPTRVVQAYGGLKLNLFELLEFTAEMAKLEFSNPGVLPAIGAAFYKDDTEAYQYSVTHFSEDYGYTLSLGYQKIGDDYYISRLASPTALPGVEPDTECWLFKTLYYPSPTQSMGANLSYVIRDNYNIKTGISGYYNLQLFESAYLNFAVSRIMDNTSVGQDELSASSSFSVSF
jgi:hypothetical protein